MTKASSTIATTYCQDDVRLAGNEATSEPNGLVPQVGLTETHLSLDDCVTTVDEWSLALLDSLDKQEVPNRSADELLRIEDDTWANLIGHNTLYRPMPDHLPRWHNDLCLHCKYVLLPAADTYSFIFF